MMKYGVVQQGRRCNEHKCRSAFILMVGNDSEAYERLMDTFKSNKAATYARVIMINPIHEDLPPFVLLL